MKRTIYLSLITLSFFNFEAYSKSLQSKSLFNDYDLDKDSFIQKQEYKKVSLDKWLTGEGTYSKVDTFRLISEVEKRFNSFDKNKDKKISKKEFAKINRARF